MFAKKQKTGYPTAAINQAGGARFSVLALFSPSFVKTRPQSGIGSRAAAAADD